MPYGFHGTIREPGPGGSGQPSVPGRVHPRFAAAEYGLSPAAAPEASDSSAMKAVADEDNATLGTRGGTGAERSEASGGAERSEASEWPLPSGQKWSKGILKGLIRIETEGGWEKASKAVEARSGPTALSKMSIRTLSSKPTITDFRPASSPVPPASSAWSPRRGLPGCVLRKPTRDRPRPCRELP